MAGLIDVGILKPELADYGRIEQQRNLLAQQKQQAELGQMKLEQLKQDRAMLNDLQVKLQAAGKSTDPNQFFSALIQSGNPDYMAKGYEGIERYKALQRADVLLRKEAPELFGEPTAAAPSAAPAAAAPSIMRMQPPAAAAAPVNALGSGTFDPNAASVNALAPAAAPAAAPTAAPSDRARELRNKVLLYSSSGDPRLKAMADVYKAELQELTKPQTLAPGQQIYAGGKVVYTAPEKDSEFEKLLTKSGLSDTEKTALRIARAKKEATHAPGTTVNLPAQEKAFETELGKEQAGSIVKSRTAAQDAASIIDTVRTGRDIMKSGMITGAGADFLVNLNQGLKTAGIDAGYADAAANSQAFTANMAGNVGKLIKQFGAGTGLSDADREFAKDMAGGRISLDPKAINRILDINERAARNVITRHNKDVKGIKTNIPLEVEMPPEIKTPAAANVVTNPQFPGFSIGK
jgi:hypothetical protein